MKFVLKLLLISVFAFTGHVFCAEENTKKTNTYYTKDGYLKLNGLNHQITTDKEYANKYIKDRVPENYQDETKDYIRSVYLLSEDIIISLIKTYSLYLMSTYENRISDKKVQTEKHILTNKWHSMDKHVQVLNIALLQIYEIQNLLDKQERLFVKMCQTKNPVSENYTLINNELQSLKKINLSNKEYIQEQIEEFNELIKKNKIVLGIKEDWKLSDYLPDFDDYKPDCLTQ